MDDTVNIVEVDPKAPVVAIYSATEAEIGRRIEQYGKVVPDCSTKEGLAFAKEARAAFREPRILIEEIRSEKKKPFLEIGRLIDSEAKRITALVAPHEKTWDDAIKADENRKEQERIAKAQAEIRRIETIRKRINEIERAPINALGFDDSEQIKVLMIKIVSLVIDDLYAEFEDEAKAKKAVTIEQLRSLYESRLNQETLKALADEAQKKLDEERAEFQAKKDADEKLLSEQREALLKQQQEFHSARAQTERTRAPEEMPKPVMVKINPKPARTDPAMLHFARIDAEDFLNEYSEVAELSGVMREMVLFLSATDKAADQPESMQA